MARHRRALLRGGDHDLLLAGAPPPVAVGLGFAHALDASLDPYLANDSFPVEGERRVGIRIELGALAAARVGIEHEPRRAGALQENEAHGWPSGARGVRERHPL